MPKLSNKEDNSGLSICCYPFLLIGSSSSQVSFALLGLVVSAVVFRDHLNSGFGFAGPMCLLPICVGTIGLFADGLFKACRHNKILVGGKLVMARLLEVKVDSTPEQSEYHLYFEYIDVSGKIQTFHTVREVNDITTGQSISFLINTDLGLGMLEADLLGRITFDNLFGASPIPKKNWLIITIIPVLSALPLFGLIGTISNWVEHIAITSSSSIYGSILLLQFLWYAVNRGSFSPGKPVQINCEPACPLEVVS